MLRIDRKLAESKGFEPLNGCPLPDFEFAAESRSMNKIAKFSPAIPSRIAPVGATGLRMSGEAEGQRAAAWMDTRLI